MHKNIRMEFEETHTVSLSVLDLLPLSHCIIFFASVPNHVTMFNLPIQLFRGSGLCFNHFKLPSNLNQLQQPTLTTNFDNQASKLLFLKVRVSFHDTVDEIDFDPGIAGPGESTTNDELSSTGDGEGGWIDPKEILHSKQWKKPAVCALKQEIIQVAGCTADL